MAKITNKNNQNQEGAAIKTQTVNVPDFLKRADYVTRGNDYAVGQLSKSRLKVDDELNTLEKRDNAIAKRVQIEGNDLLRAKDSTLYEKMMANINRGGTDVAKRVHIADSLAKLPEYRKMYVKSSDIKFPGVADSTLTNPLARIYDRAIAKGTDTVVGTEEGDVRQAQSLFGPRRAAYIYNTTASDTASRPVKPNLFGDFTPRGTSWSPLYAKAYASLASKGSGSSVQSNRVVSVPIGSVEGDIMFDPESGFTKKMSINPINPLILGVEAIPGRPMAGLQRSGDINPNELFSGNESYGDNESPEYNAYITKLAKQFKYGNR